MKVKYALLIGVATFMFSLSAFAVCSNGTWTQFAENNDTGSGTRTTASYYYTTTTGVCDDDPDTDYVFVYKGNFYACNPDKIRYDNGSYINSQDLKISRVVTSDDDVHLCMGDNTLYWYYQNSPQVVINNLKLYKLP